jgi:enediyne biosynthesis protein E3
MFPSVRLHTKAIINQANPRNGSLPAIEKLIGFLRHPIRKALCLRPTEADFSTRGFHCAVGARSAHLEKIGHSFIAGHNTAWNVQSVPELRKSIDDFDLELRGFAVEGAAMASGIRSSMQFSSGGIKSVIEAFRRDFDYLTHVGVGWAIARTPWNANKLQKVLDPIHKWLAYDGLGFHDAYFHHDLVLSGWRRRLSDYAQRAYNQGVGRALWFISGGEPLRAAELILIYPSKRRSDLWSGLGLALAYAGPLVEQEELHNLIEKAGECSPQFAQGIAFGCEARVKANFVPLYTDLVVRTVWGDSPSAIAGLVGDVRRELPRRDTTSPRYELWRHKISEAFRRNKAF